MLGNSLLNKLWNIITGCIVSLMQYCSQQRQLETMGGRHRSSIPQCWTCWQESSTAGSGHDTVGVAARWRNCCLCTDCLMVSCSVIRWALLGIKEAERWALYGSFSLWADGSSMLSLVEVSGGQSDGSSTPCALQDVSTLRLHSRQQAHRCGHYWRGRSMWRVTSTVSGL